ncbi:hypothetical protein CPC08DRAFT_770823 [Agrocybe pediades]|nr:hypothetical protein CPC08DRAFT_770823 [Agrocybe pediades]
MRDSESATTFSDPGSFGSIGCLYVSAWFLFLLASQLPIWAVFQSAPWLTTPEIPVAHPSVTIQMGGAPFE